MKKLLVVTLVVLCISSLLAQVVEKTGKDYIPTGEPQGTFQKSRVPGDLSIVIPPVEVKSTFYDYQPGSYCSTPLRIQTDDSGNVIGAYVSYHATETSTALRRVYLSHITANGTVDYSNYLNSEDKREGYPGIDIDPETQDPFVAWHVYFDADTHYDVAMNFDQYHFIGSPGILATPFAVIDNYRLYQNGVLEFEDDEFIWPYVYIVNGPTYATDGMRRIYVTANNFTSHDPDDSASENVLIAYADFSTADVELGDFSTLDWNYVRIPELDGYNQADPYWARMQKGFAATDDGRVAYFGLLSMDADLDDDDLDELVCFYNDNWGEGEWMRASVDPEHGMPSGSYIDNVQNQDGSWAFNNTESGNPATEIYLDHGALCSHPNVWFDAEGRIHLVGSQILLYNDPDDATQTYVRIYNDYVKDYVYDFNNDEFQVNDMWPQSENPNDGIFVPWDLNPEDGEVDEYDPDGNVLMAECWPIWWYDYDDGFHENSFKVVGREDGLMVAVWEDGLYNKYFNGGGDTNYEDWNEIIEIAIQYSVDNGHTWSAPMKLNGKADDENYYPELDGMIPAYVYPGDVIESVDETHSRVHLFFLDDNSYGSFIQSNGSDLGGTLEYMVVEFEHEEVISAKEDASKAKASFAVNTYPNPFNPTANISFSTKKAGNVNVNVYNVKGELVKTLVNNEFKQADNHIVKWNGVDNSGKKAATGVYFFKVETVEGTATQKALMLK